MKLDEEIDLYAQACELALGFLLQEVLQTQPADTRELIIKIAGEIEKHHIALAMIRQHENKEQAAKALNIMRPFLEEIVNGIKEIHQNKISIISFLDVIKKAEDIVRDT